MSATSEPTSLLAQPIRLGQRQLRNRVIAAPMERNLATQDGRVTPAYIRYLESRAEGGAALVFTESSYVRADGKARRLQMGIHEDGVLDPLRTLVEALHRHGALAGVELNHGGRTAQRAVNGVDCVAPSPVPCHVVGGEVPRELDDDDIREIIAAYADAARRCEQAGVDVVMLHGAHGYLIHQFLSPRTNHRKDRWADPTRFLAEVVAAVRAAVPTTTLGLRISAVEGPDDGLDAEQTLALVARAPLEELDFLDVSAGSYEAGEWIVQPSEWREGVLAPYAASYRALGLPVSVAGRVASPETAERILRAGHADLVSVARALHADPQWARAAVTRSPFRPCIATNHCIDQLFTMQPVPCSVNPDVGAPAHDPPQDLAATPALVVGAGPAGLEASRRLAARGADVTLVERDVAIGGALRWAAGLRMYPAFTRLLTWYDEELARLGVDLRLGVEATAELIAAEGPHAVVIASGGRTDIPSVGATASSRVRSLRGWLRDGARDLGDEVHTIWGADREGASVADDLLAGGKRVLLVGSEESLAPDLGRRAKILLVPRLEGHPDVEIVLGARMRSIDDAGLVVGVDGADRRLDAPGPLLVSGHLGGDDRLRAALVAGGWKGECVVVGDAGGHGPDLARAIADGARAVERLRVST